MFGGVFAFGLRAALSVSDSGFRGWGIRLIRLYGFLVRILGPCAVVGSAQPPKWQESKALPELSDRLEYANFSNIQGSMYLPRRR